MGDHTLGVSDFLVSGVRRRGLLTSAAWELACQKIETVKADPTDFALYPLPLKKTVNGVAGQCYDSGFIYLLTTSPVMEFYCRPGFNRYLETHNQLSTRSAYRGWITCDTLMQPESEQEQFSLEQAIRSGAYNPSTQEEFVGCSCKKGEYMFAYRASKKQFNEQRLLSMEIKCAPALGYSAT